MPIKKYLSNVEKYKLEKLELLTNRAIIAAKNKIRPLAASSLKNHLNGDEIILIINYFNKSLKNKNISIKELYKLFNKSFILGNITEI
tara:strand:- start:15 stop:278 length:264 start_codon:yes stop_codon:yes gene_type:complete